MSTSSVSAWLESGCCSSDFAYCERQHVDGSSPWVLSPVGEAGLASGFELIQPWQSQAFGE